MQPYCGWQTKQGFFGMFKDLPASGLLNWTQFKQRSFCRLIFVEWIRIIRVKGRTGNPRGSCVWKVFMLKKKKVKRKKIFFFCRFLHHHHWDVSVLQPGWFSAPHSSFGPQRRPAPADGAPASFLESRPCRSAWNPFGRKVPAVVRLVWCGIPSSDTENCRLSRWICQNLVRAHQTLQPCISVSGNLIRRFAGFPVMLTWRPRIQRIA